MRFRPSLPLTAVVAVALVILVNLSLWQARRHVAQEAHLADVDARLTGEPLGVDALDRPADELAWHEAVLRGHFTEATPFLVTGRYEFGKPGFDVIAPFAVDGGPTLLVNRGWIPAEDWATHLQAIAVEGTTQVEGLLLAIEPHDPVAPLAEKGDLPERWPMATESFWGIGRSLLGPPWQSLAERAGDVADVYLTVGPALSAGHGKAREPLPVSGYVARPKEIGHFSYSVQWALIALTLVAVWIALGVRRGAAPPAP